MTLKSALNRHIKKISALEGKKKEVIVGNIREVLAASNKATNGLVYATILAFEENILHIAGRSS